MLKRILTLPPVAFLLELLELYGRTGIARSAAALAYFLVLTLFPVLVCVNYCIGLLQLDLEQIITSVERFLPQAALTALTDYLRYVSLNQSPPLLLASVFTLLLCASAGLRNLLLTMDELFEVSRRGLRRTILSVALSGLFLPTMYLSVVVILTGDWFFRLLEDLLPDALIALIPLATLSGLWHWIRYLLLFCFVLLLVLGVYCLGIPRSKVPRSTLLMFSMLTALTMVASSGIFSLFIGMSSRYALVYGSLASLIILLVWLYFCGNVLLLGAALCRVWTRRRSI
ncbi:MAG: YihY/virulence factor BrkB family protein [Clostridium sp.]|nr:YihY/virulence factor BrkB family protein [Clostridium sp.]